MVRFIAGRITTRMSYSVSADIPLAADVMHVRYLRF